MDADALRERLARELQAGPVEIEGLGRFYTTSRRGFGGDVRVVLVFHGAGLADVLNGGAARGPHADFVQALADALEADHEVDLPGLGRLTVSGPAEPGVKRLPVLRPDPAFVERLPRPDAA